MTFEFAVFRDSVLDVKRRYLGVETRITAYRDAAGIRCHQLFQMAHLRIRDLSPFVIIGVLGNQPSRIGVQCFLLGPLQLEVQHMQPVVDIRPDTYPFGDMGFPHTGTGKKAGQLPPQVASGIERVQKRDIEPGHTW